MLRSAADPAPAGGELGARMSAVAGYPTPCCDVAGCAGCHCGSFRAGSPDVLVAHEDPVPAKRTSRRVRCLAGLVDQVAVVGSDASTRYQVVVEYRELWRDHDPKRPIALLPSTVLMLRCWCPPSPSASRMIRWRRPSSDGTQEDARVGVDDVVIAAPGCRASWSASRPRCPASARCCRSRCPKVHEVPGWRATR